jgi:hypothetical protein
VTWPDLTGRKVPRESDRPGGSWGTAKMTECGRRMPRDCADPDA